MGRGDLPDSHAAPEGKCGHISLHMQHCNTMATAL